ncbi:MAG: putative lipid II flippase FtsW [Nitrospirae bacterium]|nr:putative lipid II flippase FtsW [Nitrospirota bacterium]
MKKTHSILIPVGILIFVGLLMVFSSTGLISKEKYGNGYHYLWMHLFTVVIGLAAMLFLAQLDYRKLNNRWVIIILLAVSLGLLILVFVQGIGVKAGGAKRWIKLWPSTFQPSELVKFTTVLSLAYYIEKYASKMKSLIYGLIIPLTVVGVFQLIIYKQPDFGAIISLSIITITLLFIGGIRLKWNYIAGLILTAAAVFYKFVWLVPYRRARVMIFWDPWKDALGKGFQLSQSFLSFGMGGVTGVGPGASKQKLFYLPELHTDFIFSLIGEEWGLIGVSCILGLFIWFFLKGTKIAERTEDPFGYYLAMGLTLMIVSQALINFAVAIGLMPTKGLPLPFISYGGSALLVNMMAVGVLISIQRSVNSKGWTGERGRYTQ